MAEENEKASEFTPTYTVLPNGQVQMTMVLPPMHPSQYPASIGAPPQMQVGYGFPQQQAPLPPPPMMPPAPYPYAPYPYQPQYPAYYPQQMPTEPKDGLVIGSMVTFIVGLFTFLPYLASLVMSFKMLQQGYLQGTKKALVCTFAIVELLAWALCASMSWFTTTECSSYYNYNYYYNQSNCYSMYWGWIFIVVWFGIGVTFGIARVVLEWNYAKRPSSSFNPSASPSSYIPLSAPVHHNM